MATKRAVKRAKKKLKFTQEELEDMDSQLIHDEECCGILRLTTCSNSRELLAARAQVREEDGDKYLLATTNQRERSDAAALRKAGFKALATFRNDNGNTITIWGASSLPKSDYKIVDDED